MKDAIKFLRVVTVIIVLFSASIPARAQDNLCRAALDAAMTRAQQACLNTGRDQICYGSGGLQAEFFPGFDGALLAQPGDTVEADAVRALRLSPVDAADGPGVSLARLHTVQAPTAPGGQNITLLFFGAVEVENLVAPPVIFPATAAVGVNVRAGPSTEEAIIESLRAGEGARVVGRLRDNSWLQIILPGDRRGWVAGQFLQVAGNLDVLDEIDPQSGPVERHLLQAFRFSSGPQGAAACPAAAAGGVLMQAPSGLGEVLLRVNEVELLFDSVVFAQAQPGGDFTLNVLDGLARVTALDMQRLVPAGTRTRVALDVALAPTGGPSAAEAYARESVASVPVAALPRPVAITPPLTRDEMNAALGIPEDGTWTVVFSEGTLICPDGVSAPVAPTAPSGSRDLTVAESGDQIFLTLEDGSPLTFNRTDFSVYAARFNRLRVGQQVPHRIVMRVLTGTRIEGEEVLTLTDGCTITLPFVMALGPA